MTNAPVERVFYEVADLDEGCGAPFAVLAIYPDRRKDNGVLAIVSSLHHDRIEAEAACARIEGKLS